MVATAKMADGVREAVEVAVDQITTKAVMEVKAVMA